MSLVAANGLTLAFGARSILDDASFTINAHDRIGLVGPNGTGKSTLLGVLSGKQALDDGELSFRRRVRTGYLPQDILELPPGTLLESVLSAVPDRDRLTSTLATLEAAIETSEEDEERIDLAAQLADLHEELAAFEERHGRQRAERILDGLGFARARFDRPVTELSGGWKMRAALAGLLLMSPDLLLLDEPTNHLDLPTLLWFDTFLARSSRALVLVSHDREFLNRQINRVISFEPEGLRAWSGDYDEYKRLRALEESDLAARAKRQAQRRAEMEAFIERFRAKATKARQVQSRIKLLEKEETVQTHEARATISFRFPEVARSGREVLRYEGLRKAFGEKVIYRGLSQTVLRGERIAIVGVNGAGKTTLLRLTAGELAADAGTITPGPNVQLAYYAQHHTDLLDRQRTILEEIWSLVPEQPQSWVRSVLGSFLFTGDDVEKRIGVLSGGERARVALARLLVVPSNLMLMDEPTNHLDIDSSEMLIEALKSYSGTLLFVSHNRSFIDQLATRVWDVSDGTIVDWPGNLSDYLHHRALEEAARAQAEQGAPEGAESGPQAPRTESDKERRRREAERRERLGARLRPLKAENERLEARIAELETEQALLEPQLADPDICADFAKLRPLTERFQANTAELTLLMERWAEVQAELEALSNEP